VETQPSLIMIQFLEWVAARPRRREDVLDAWQSSCPRFPVWEDARAEGFVRQCGGELGEHRVELTARGRKALDRAGQSVSTQAARNSGPTPNSLGPNRTPTRNMTAALVREPIVPE